MKTLHANGPLVGGTLMLGLVELLLIWLDICTPQFGSSMVFLICFIPVVFWAIKIRSTHWIRYGEGKLVIRRVSKMWQSGWPPAVGKWQNREDEFLLEDIESWGDAEQFLGRGRHLEYPPGGYDKYGFMREILFRLKNGRKVTFMTSHFTKKQVEELFRYLRDEGKIEMTK